MNRFEGKVALVTGGAGEIGAATVERLRAEGARVWSTDIAAGAEHRHDVTSSEDWLRILGEIEREAGRLDLLVNNAGLASPALSDNPLTVTVEHWRRMAAVNFEGALIGSQAAFPILARCSGAIVNVSSLASMVATPFDTAYGAAKAALAQFTLSFAKTAAARGVRCNSIHPGLIWTRMNSGLVDAMARNEGAPAEAVRAGFAARVPLGDYGRPADVAAAVSWLGGQDARYVTGHALIVDGGLSIG
jgi:3(or 17)beta-hydroxysteroid dehydrogenase